MSFLATHRTVKLWDHQQRHPLMSFDLGNPGNFSPCSLSFACPTIVMTRRKIRCAQGDARALQPDNWTFGFLVAVGDVQWSPYSSTVFAAVSNDGKVLT